jgi:hypothetical protein
VPSLSGFFWRCFFSLQKLGEPQSFCFFLHVVYHHLKKKTLFPSRKNYICSCRVGLPVNVESREFFFFFVREVINKITTQKQLSGYGLTMGPWFDPCMRDHAHTHCPPVPGFIRQAGKRCLQSHRWDFATTQGNGCLWCSRIFTQARCTSSTPKMYRSTLSLSRVPTTTHSHVHFLAKGSGCGSASAMHCIMLSGSLGAAVGSICPLLNRVGERNSQGICTLCWPGHCDRETSQSPATERRWRRLCPTCLGARRSQ